MCLRRIAHTVLAFASGDTYMEALERETLEKDLAEQRQLCEVYERVDRVRRQLMELSARETRRART